MPRFIVLLAIIPFLTFTSNQIDADQQPRENYLKSGTWSLQFMIQSLIRLTPFQGGVISAKYHRSPNRAVRFGLDLSGSLTEQSNTNTSSSTNQNSLTTESYQISEQTGFDIGLSIQYLYYQSPAKRVSFFYGTGPFIGIGKQKLDRTVENTNITPGRPTSMVKELLHQDLKSWNFGLSGLTGVEWFASHSISFIAEYEISMGYQYSNKTDTSERNFSLDSNTEIRTSIEKKTSWFINSNKVNFGLSVYF